MGKRSKSMLDRMSSVSPQYAAFGTHRAAHAHAFQDNLGRFDKQKDVALIQRGRNWKSTPGPGTYRTPLTIAVSGEKDSVLINFFAVFDCVDKQFAFSAWKVSESSIFALNSFRRSCFLQPWPS